MTTSKTKTPLKKVATSKAVKKSVAKPTPEQQEAVSAAVKAVVAAPKTAPVVVEGPQPVVSGPVMRKKELIDAVVERSGIKKKDAKPVVEAMLAVLGEALADNRELNIQPLGKIKVRRAKQMQNGRVLVTKIRQSTAMDDSAEDIPTAAE